MKPRTREIEFATDPDPTAPAPIQTPSAPIPAQFLKGVTIPEPIQMKDTDGIPETLKASVADYNTLQSAVHALWLNVNSFSRAIVVINEVRKLIELRHEILGHPYGIGSRGNPKGGQIFPVE